MKRWPATAQSGFTLIELIVVIVILGILAATALPRFIDLRGDAVAAATQGFAGAAASAMNLNFAGCTVANHTPAANRCVQVNATNGCTTALVSSLLQDPALPANYAVTGTASAVNGTAFTCTLTNSNANPARTANFTGIAAGN